VSHANEEAQAWFDQGLNLVYAFNHDESVKAFAYAAALSPECAMCFWGVAYAHGPHINNTSMSAENAKAAVAAIRQAQTLADRAEPAERALIQALAQRYHDPELPDRGPLDTAYAEAMRAVWKQFPKDADIGALTAEALMDLHPWDLHTSDGKPKPWTPEIIAVTQATLALSPAHPMGNHLLIHALEASDEPGLAQAAADRLRDAQPGLGHMVHMPSHIDVRTGHWDAAIVANQKAIAADARYRARVPKQGFYALLMMHNQHMLAYAAMMSGRSAETLAAMKGLVDGIPDDFRRNAPADVDAYFALPLEALMRFGRWDELLAVPDFAEDLPAARALRHAARGVAFAAKRDVPHALEEKGAFEAARSRVPAKTAMGLNSVVTLNELAGHLLAGEILYAQAKPDAAFAELRQAVAAEDTLRYDEPPDWIQPARHALGAALIQSRRFAEAEVVFREDLHRTPDNGWALFGLAQALRMQGKKAEADPVEKAFQRVWVKADLPLHAACLCQPGI